MIRQLKPNERREAILITLCKRRYDTISNLAQEFGVSVSITVVKSGRSNDRQKQ